MMAVILVLAIHAAGCGGIVLWGYIRDLRATLVDRDWVIDRMVEEAGRRERQIWELEHTRDDLSLRLKNALDRHEELRASVAEKGRMFDVHLRADELQRRLDQDHEREMHSLANRMADLLRVGAKIEDFYCGDQRVIRVDVMPRHTESLALHTMDWSPSDHVVEMVADQMAVRMAKTIHDSVMRVLGDAFRTGRLPTARRPEWRNNPQEDRSRVKFEGYR